MKYLTKFETSTAFESYTLNENNTPNVSLIEELMNTTGGIVYTKKIPPHDYVKIGGIKWATMNLGANSVTDTGLYYQWGDTQGYTEEQVGNGSGQKYFGESDYKYYNDGNYTKYNDNDELVTLLPEDDAVTVAWGGNWRMPTESECALLEESTDMDFTSDYQGSGVSGFTFTDKTDSSKVLFFPINKTIRNGKTYSTELTNENPKGFIWTSSLASYRYDVSDAQDFPNTFHAYGTLRSNGRGIRGILDNSDSETSSDSGSDSGSSSGSTDNENWIKVTFTTYSGYDGESDIEINSGNEYTNDYVKSMEIDGELLPNVVNTYRFDAGAKQHTIKYNLLDGINYVTTGLFNSGADSLEFGKDINMIYDAVFYNPIFGLGFTIKFNSMIAPNIESESLIDNMAQSTNVKVYIPTGATGYDVLIGNINNKLEENEKWTIVEF